ncbi:hypothetical protein OQA88_13079 [Cercophora sp. LCS_1]
MEASPLIKAHDHARAASHATQTSDTTVAISEHALAAGEFANAAKNTGSVEALRTLRLLEQHHIRLSELLKLPSEPPSQQSTVDGDIPEEDYKDGSNGQDAQNKSPKSSTTETPAAATAALNKPLPTLQHRRYPGRELSSSIASNLASARGIKSKYRGQPLAPSVSNDQAPGSLESRPRREGSHRGRTADGNDHARKPSWVPPTEDDIKEDAVSESSKSGQNSPAPAAEEGFSRFYSTFSSVMKHISAPLAFAGLPLISEDSAAEPTPAPAPEPSHSKKSRERTPVQNDPEISQFFSRATMRALNRGLGDSFHVIPAAGNVRSYASVLLHENKEKRRNAASRDGNDPDDQDDDDFVDARESQVPMAQGYRRAGKKPTEKELLTQLEEKTMETAHQKEIIDKLTRRLHAFELNSQSTHLALAQSIRLQRPGSPMSSSGGKEDEALKKRNRELEEQIASLSQRMASLEREKDKLQQTVEKYRVRWEQLKAGAKARREAQEQGGDSEPSK